jgi:predicted Holliday junction resolvase-like endonuclease
MSGLMWLLFVVMMAVLVLSVVWLIVKLRHFSYSQNQTYMDDKLMQAILKDEMMKKEMKNALLKQAGGVIPAEDEQQVPEEEQEKKEPSGEQP